VNRVPARTAKVARIQRVCGLRVAVFWQSWQAKGVSVPKLKNDRLLKACRREAVDRAPIWLMRQAGRYMPEYRALRAKHTILEMIKAPDLATEVTLQPIDAFGMDAAIIFADILPLLEAMDLDLEFIPGTGPVIHNPIRHTDDIKRLVPADPEEKLSFTLEAIRQTTQALDGRVPLIGFSGAPFTLACYAINGGGSKDWLIPKQFMYEQPEAFAALMDQLTEAVAAYMVAQVKAGAPVVQLFDSWAGILSPKDYRRWVLPSATKILAAVKEADPKALTIHFATGSAGILHLVKEAGSDVVGVDWRVDIKQAWDGIGHDVAVQGNMDPAILLAPKEDVCSTAREIVDSVGGRPGYIFNLGHGIHKQTDPENVRALVNAVQQTS